MLALSDLPLSPNITRAYVALVYAELLFACGGRSDSLKAQQGLGERVPERHHY